MRDLIITADLSKLLETSEKPRAEMTTQSTDDTGKRLINRSAAGKAPRAPRIKKTTTLKDTAAPTSL